MHGASGTVLRSEHLDVVLGGSRILADVSVTVRAGEIVALLGANGSGKSTFVRAALGVLPTARGTVELFGRPLGRGTPWGRIGYVPQRMPASTGIPTTALEVVRAGTLSAGHLRRATRRAALDALAAMGIADRAEQPVQEMSGGQQQRVLIARALVRRPDLLVLDEPTTGIDLGTIETFVATIGRMRESGTAVLVILHETEAFASLLDRAVVLRHGRVVHDGPPPPARGEHADLQHEHAHPHAQPEHPESTLGLDVIGGDA